MDPKLGKLTPISEISDLHLEVFNPENSPGIKRVIDYLNNKTKITTFFQNNLETLIEFGLTHFPHSVTSLNSALKSKSDETFAQLTRFIITIRNIQQC